MFYNSLAGKTNYQNKIVFQRCFSFYVLPPFSTVVKLFTKMRLMIDTEERNKPLNKIKSFENIIKIRQ